MILRRNAPTPVGQATIAASNIWEEDYELADGTRARGMTAHFWIMHDKATHAKLRVHPGQELAIPGAFVRVLGIDRQGVEIEVTPR